ncbi:MAG: hypothetical protein WCY84_02730, partial [Candidatus Cloacimonadaceae bacterium]
ICNDYLFGVNFGGFKALNPYISGVDISCSCVVCVLLDSLKTGRITSFREIIASNKTDGCPPYLKVSHKKCGLHPEGWLIFRTHMAKYASEYSPYFGLCFNPALAQAGKTELKHTKRTIIFLQICLLKNLKNG